jgi:hypothetical protein
MTKLFAKIRKNYIKLAFSSFFCIFVVVKYALKHIITSLTLVCFLTATNGLSLIEHYCSVKKKSFLFLIADNATCDVHSCTPIDEQSCCSHEHTTDCCQNFNHFAKLDVDYFSTQNNIDVDCPVVQCRRCCPYCSTFSSALLASIVCDFSEYVGLPEQLLIKRTTELLL